MSLLSATLKQIGLPPWDFAASQTREPHNAEGYYTKDSKQQRQENREKAAALLLRIGAAYTEDVAAKLNLDLPKARAVISGLTKSKIAYRLEDGRYDLIPEVRKSLSAPAANPERSGQAAGNSKGLAPYYEKRGFRRT